MENFHLGQVFYGRGPDGYNVLGASPAGRPFVGAVANLCKMVGSPDHPGTIPSFLLSKREGNSVMMVRACRGVPDSTRRATVFFHALVAEAEALRAEDLDAFVLADAGAFSSTCPGREPPDLSLPVPKPRPGRTDGPRSIEFPATISSERPLNDFVRRELGADVLGKDWSTFSYNPLPGFDLCVLSACSPHKGDGTRYVYDEAGIRRIPDCEKSPARTPVLSPMASIRKVLKSPGALYASLAANAILLLALLAGGGKSGKGAVVPDPPRELTEDEAKARWSEKWEDEWKKSLPPPPAEMTEEEAKAKWEPKWKLQWEADLPPPPAKMTEGEAKAKWEPKWKLQWEADLPPPPAKMTEDEAKENWEEDWKKVWEESLRNDFKEELSDVDWNVKFDDDDGPFTKSVREYKSELKDGKLEKKWKIYQSSKKCFDFLNDFLNNSKDNKTKGSDR